MKWNKIVIIVIRIRVINTADKKQEVWMFANPSSDSPSFSAWQSKFTGLKNNGKKKKKKKKKNQQNSRK